MSKVKCPQYHCYTCRKSFSEDLKSSMDEDDDWIQNTKNTNKMEKYRKALVEELASKGNKEAILEMARSYMNDESITKTKAKQIERYLLQLADNNDNEAIVLLGGLYYEGSSIVNQRLF
jgi:transposase-like protein